MVRVLYIDEAKRAEIEEAVRRAEAKPIPFATLAGAILPDRDVIALADRKPGFERPASEHVLIPRGYRAAFSIEEQPVGLCLHLSISVDKKGKVPNEHAVKEIAAAYGITSFDRVWLEEFDPGHHAVNIIEVRPRQ